MLVLVTNPRRVAQLQKQLQAEVFAAADAGPRKREIGAPGGRWSVRMVHFDKGDWWFGACDFGTRWGNAVGFGDPLTLSGAFAPVAEANPPKVPTSRKSQAAFAEDEQERVYLVHRGGIRRRKKDGKDFLDWYPEALRREMKDVVGVTRVIVVGHLGGGKMVPGLKGFLGLVSAYREGGKPAKKDTVDAAGALDAEEPTGTSSYRKTEGEIQIDWKHGRVVKALKAKLKKAGLMPQKDQKRDLFTVRDGQQDLLFEVKVGWDTQSLYTAVGQLAWHATPGARRVAVVPDKTPVEALRRMTDLGITCLPYRWEEDELKVKGLKALVE